MTVLHIENHSAAADAIPRHFAQGVGYPDATYPFLPTLPNVSLDHLLLPMPGMIHNFFL